MNCFQKVSRIRVLNIPWPFWTISFTPPPSPNRKKFFFGKSTFFIFTHCMSKPKCLPEDWWLFLVIFQGGGSDTARDQKNFLGEKRFVLKTVFASGRWRENQQGPNEVFVGLFFSLFHWWLPFVERYLILSKNLWTNMSSWHLQESGSAVKCVCSDLINAVWKKNQNMQPDQTSGETVHVKCSCWGAKHCSIFPDTGDMPNCLLSWGVWTTKNLEQGQFYHVVREFFSCPEIPCTEKWICLFTRSKVSSKSVIVFCVSCWMFLSQLSKFTDNSYSRAVLSNFAVFSTFSD